MSYVKHYPAMMLYAIWSLLKQLNFFDDMRNLNNKHKYVSGDWPLSTHADPTRGSALDESASARATPAWPTGQLDSALARSRRPRASARGTRAGRFVRFWASEEQSSPKCEIPCLGGRWTTVQNLTPLGLSSAEKSSTVPTHTKNKQ